MPAKFLFFPFIAWLLVTTILFFYIAFSLDGFEKKIKENHNTSERIEQKINHIYSILDPDKVHIELELQSNQ